MRAERGNNAVTDSMFGILPVRICLAACACMLLASCSVKRMTANMVGNALSGPGGVFTTDDDPELIREAIPFGLKTYESLLQTVPDHRGLLLAAASGFSAYAYLLKDEADRMGEDNLKQSRAQRSRARKLFLRGRDFAIRGLATKHKGVNLAALKQHETVLADMQSADVPYLYWAGAAWAGALSAAKDDMSLIADLPIAAALVERAIELDPGFDGGAAHEFFIAYEGSRPGGSNELAREHYKQALAHSDGKRASVHLALAESVSVNEQNLAEFRELLDKAQAVDPDAVPDQRLANVIAQRRADWLSDQAADLFFDAE